MELLRHVPAHVMLVEYRGYGDSPTNIRPSEKGIKLDAEAAILYAHQELVRQESERVDPNKLFVFGRSLGGAVALHLAAYAEGQGIPVCGVILENTFTSISDVSVDEMYAY
jgi:pimeloyl-ACP methyl ester carboxylesterase